MAIVVLAQLESMESTGKADENKYDIKLNLLRMLYKKGYNKQQVSELFKFIDWIINLPEFLDEKINKEMLKLEEVEKMTYVTSMEKYGIKQGKKQTQLEIAENMLNMEFAIKDIAKATDLTQKEIKDLKKKL